MEIPQTVSMFDHPHGISLCQVRISQIPAVCYLLSCQYASQKRHVPLSPHLPNRKCHTILHGTDWVYNPDPGSSLCPHKRRISGAALLRIKFWVAFSSEVVPCPPICYSSHTSVLLAKNPMSSRALRSLNFCIGLPKRNLSRVGTTSSTLFSPQ